MDKQLNIFEATAARDAGMQTAIEHAEAVHEVWSDKAYAFLLSYARNCKQPFMVEDVRAASMENVPEPPSKRAWGGIVAKAAKAGIIQHAGYAQVKNIKAHCTPAAVWKACTNPVNKAA